MPAQHDEESTRRLREEIQQKSELHPGGESQTEMQARIQKEHIEKLQEQGIPLAEIQTGYTPKHLKEKAQANEWGHTPIRREDGPLDSPVIEGPWRLGGKAEQILQKLEVDEPIFILRAKDIFSTMVIAKYLEIVEAYGPSDHEFQRTITETLQDFKDWQGNNTDKVRYPD